MNKEAIGNFVPSPRRLPAFLTKALALVAVSFVAGVGSAEARPEHIDQQSVAGELRPLSDLPGFDMYVRPFQLDALRNSAVKISTTSIGESGNRLVNNCSGNKLDYRGADFVTSAAHCFVGNLDSTEAGLLGSSHGNKKAFDFINDFESVEIRDMSLPVAGEAGSLPVYKSPEPMALATGVSLGYRKGDDALLRVATVPSFSKGTSSIPSRSFDQVRALSYKPAVKEPTPGQQVAVYGAPGPRNVGIGRVGRYLGRMNLSPTRHQELDMVALKAPNIVRDPCEPGASGSTAITADGHVLGSLSFGEQLTFNGFITDDGEAYVPLSYKPSVYEDWDRIENTLNVDIPYAFNEICMYGVRDPNSLTNLLGGFGVYATSSE